MKVTVLGAGAWGTALGIILNKNGHEVTLWGHEAAHLEALAKTQRLDRGLPGIPLPQSFRYEVVLEKAAASSEVIVLAVPSKAFREVAKNLPAMGKILVSVTKGLEFQTGLTMLGILEEIVPGNETVALSGPTFALEVAQGYPTAIVAASKSSGAVKVVQDIFHRPSFRVYTSNDPLGVELGGALKNVIAIAAGVGDGIGLGDNSKAALVTRALAEIKRLGVARSAQSETFSGLSGLGDLTATCFSKLSRNRQFGERIGRGEKVADMQNESTPLAEGFPTTRSAWHLAQKLGVDTPIIEQAHCMLYEGKDVRQALEDLTARSSKAENR